MAGNAHQKDDEDAHVVGEEVLQVVLDARHNRSETRGEAKPARRALCLGLSYRENAYLAQQKNSDHGRMV